MHLQLRKTLALTSLFLSLATACHSQAGKNYWPETEVYPIEFKDKQGRVADFNATLKIRRYPDSDSIDVQVSSDTLYFLRPIAWDRWYWEGDRIEVRLITFEGTPLVDGHDRTVLAYFDRAPGDGTYHSSLFGVGKVRKLELDTDSKRLEFSPLYVSGHELFFYGVTFSINSHLPTEIDLYTPDGNYQGRVKY